MITVTKEGYRLHLTGHAGYAAHGEDIVCAAVSALFCTLSGGVTAHEELLERIPVVCARPGDSLLECSPREECRREVDLLYDVILSGIYSVATEHPEHVRVIIK